MKGFIYSLLVLITVGCVNTANQVNRPNILFVISDDQSFAHTSFAGCEIVNTPAFDRIANEGVYFNNCYAGSPGCAPSRSTIVTGRYHWQNEQSGQHASSWMKKYVPFIDLLDANGYVSGRTGKGVDPFQYARNEKDTLWRATNAAGIEHSSIKYKANSSDDERTASKISKTDYFENFKYFVENVRDDKPFFFWYGSNEPHRAYEQGSWKRTNKKLEDVNVPDFFPDSETVRGDILDYAVEIDWFDLHLQRMLQYLEQLGELDNTIVIVTADNGMPFPRCKANTFEYGSHVPFAIRYPKDFKGGRIINDPINFIDIAPTILEITNTSPKGMMPITGKSFLNILKSNEQGKVDDSREYTFSGRERHSSSRYLNWGYPQRAIRSEQHLLIWNMKPERWPAGAPQLINPDNPEDLLPMYGIDSSGKHVRNWAFTDIDAGPTKTYLIENCNDTYVSDFFDLSVAKRQEFELYDVQNDPYCLKNLYETKDVKEVQNAMTEALLSELEKSGDPRIVGQRSGFIFQINRCCSLLIARCG